jgi:protein-L-isoaspartate(D-aspartate) O-methyltransferase
MILRLLHCAAAWIIMIPIATYGGCSTDWPGQSDKKSQRSSPFDEDRFQRLREKMVRRQLQGRDVKDRSVLNAMLRVPRHRFVIPSAIDAAYDDSALPLMLGQTISQPYIVGYMTQALRLKGGERVLEIGTGSGYQAAVLAEIVQDVYTIEILKDLSGRAQSILNSLGYPNIHFRVGDGYQGWPEFAPYDCIIVTAAPDHVPQPLIDQLKPGGRMIIPVGNLDQQLMLLEKGEEGVVRRATIPVRFVPMTGRAQEPPN